MRHLRNAGESLCLVHYCWIAFVCRWVSNLSRFLQHVVGQLGRRLTLENSPKEVEDGSDSESDDGSEAPLSGQGDDDQVDIELRAHPPSSDALHN